MKQKILIIEDNEQNMYLMTFLLEKHGYEIYKSYNGRDGIRAVFDVRPHAILLDIQLPEMDGYQVAQELTRHGAFEGIPIIAVTSYAMAGDRERILAAGATGYIEKPINPDSFVAQIQEYLPPSDGSRD